MLEIHSLAFKYPKTGFCLQVPKLDVARGEKVAVIGPSGSGKTTLLNLVAGILVAEAGRVTIDGVAMNALDDAQRRRFRIARIGFVFQDFRLLDYLSVFDNILHPYRITPALQLDADVRKHAVDLAERMGIGDKLNRPVQNLSQGEQQRTAICRALLPRPGLILADEATGNLDPDNKLHILDLLFERVDHSASALLAVTHDHELLPRFDRVVDFRDFRADT